MTAWKINGAAGFLRSNSVDLFVRTPIVAPFEYGYIIWWALRGIRFRTDRLPRHIWPNSHRVFL